jgi:hypothetical protein
MEIESEPVHLFASGRRAPRLPARRSALQSLAGRRIYRGAQALNGTPPKVLAARDKLLEALRNELAACDEVR